LPQRDVGLGGQSARTCPLQKVSGLVGTGVTFGEPAVDGVLRSPGQSQLVVVDPGQQTERGPDGLAHGMGGAFGKRAVVQAGSGAA